MSGSTLSNAPTADDTEERVASVRPRSIAAGGIDTVVFRIIEMVCLLGLVIVTGRLMQPAGRGLYAEASVVAGLCSLPFGAMWISNAVEITRRRIDIREVFGGAMVIALWGGLVTAAVAFVVAPFFGSRWWLIAIPAAVTPFMLLGRYQEGIYTAIGYVRAVNLMRVARAILPLFFLVPPLVLGGSSRTAVCLWVLWWVALAILVMFPLRSLIGGPRLPKDRRYYRRVLAYGVKMAGLNTIQYLRERLGIISLAFFTTDARVGVYSIAVSATQVLLISSEALSLSAFQRMGSSELQSSAALTARTVRHSLLLVSVGSVLLVPFSIVAIPLAVGPGYEDVPLLLALLIPATIALGALLSIVQFFMVQAQKPRVLVAVSGSSLVANAILTVSLAPVWGAVGVAIGTSVGFMIGLTVAFRRFCAETGTPFAAMRPGWREISD